MSNKAPSKNFGSNNDFLKSTFTLTFTLEILGLDIWHDCNEGWIDLGTCFQGMKLQYQLYPGQNYDIDLLIWPHVVKIWCGTQHAWVRTWQFLERRWFAFSIRHAFPVRVMDFSSHVATVVPTFGFGVLSNNAKNDKNLEIYLPGLAFGEQRYFAGASEGEKKIDVFMKDLIWNLVEKYIPASYMDGMFDMPSVVNDVRHQDAVVYNVQDIILNRVLPEEPEPEDATKPPKDKLDSKAVKDKKKPMDLPKTKFEIRLTGDAILAGAGRITKFETVGDRPIDLGESVIIISSSNLPAADDLPIIFVNIENLYDIPLEDFKKAGVSQIYACWKLGDEEHSTEKQQLKQKSTVQFDDHHAVPLDPPVASAVTTDFLDNLFEIEIRGIRSPSSKIKEGKLFGQEKTDSSISNALPAHTNELVDFPIAITKIDACSLAKGLNGLVRGEFSLYPPEKTAGSLGREAISTNDINAIRSPIKPNVIVQPSIILRAQMTLEVSMGFVGCKPKELIPSFSRLFCLVDDSDTVVALLRKIAEINEEVVLNMNRDCLLTGFVVDTGDKALFYIEGQRHGPILKIWHMVEDFYSKLKTLFSSSYNYASRLYPEMVNAPIPFNVLKMFVPLGVLLACPPVYVRPTLPVPARRALLKFGSLVASTFRVTPCRNDMPSCEELKSFRLELCIPPRPGGSTHINLVPAPSVSHTALLENFIKVTQSRLM